MNNPMQGDPLEDVGKIIIASLAIIAILVVIIIVKVISNLI
jgi:hypothetical protein